MILEVVAGTGFEPAHLRIMSMVGLAGLEPARMLLRRQVLYPLSYRPSRDAGGTRTRDATALQEVPLAVPAQRHECQVLTFGSELLERMLTGWLATG
jgi:hypothetical protein